MDASRGWPSRLRQPEYTGENRCLPCTVVNLTIALVAALAAGMVGLIYTTTPVGIGLTALILALSATSIYLRGYLIPGTPELTKRYFPAWLLRWFGKAPETPVVTDASDLDPEEELVSIGALEECETRDDLCLTAGFRDEWNAQIEQIDAADTGRDRLLDMLDVDEGEVSIEEFNEAFRAKVEGQTVGTWESKAAYLADLASARSLADRHPNWETLPVRHRSRLLDGLRLFIERCPACGGQAEFGTETVESCCSSREVAAVECGDCGPDCSNPGP